MKKEVNWEWIDEMFELADTYGCEKACNHCPYKAKCEAEEMWWGCPVWEEQMGEDL